MIVLPPYLDNITPFYAVEIFQAAEALEAQGRSVIHLEFGEPDLPTPEPIVRAGIRALEAGHTRYTNSMGIPALREAICAWYQRRYGVRVQPDQVLVSAGTSVLTFLLMKMLLAPGDEVILPDPTYACYANFIRLAHGVPVSVPIKEADGFQIDPEAVRAAITPRTKALMVCSPANPTGVALRPDVMQALTGLGIPVISDEIYHGLNYAGKDQTLLAHGEESIVLSGFSKYFAMTGWRLGYMIMPPALAATAMKLHQNVMISAPDFTQHAGIAAMTEAEPICEQYRAEYDRRRVFLVERLREIGLPLHYEPTGAFYVFADARHIEGNSLKLALDILEHAGVALTPGFDFGPGGEGYLRFSYANSLENITDAMNRLDGYLKKRG